MPPIIDTDKCIGCGICAQICDNEVLIIENKAKINNAEDCDECGFCVDDCPQAAIMLKY